MKQQAPSTQLGSHRAKAGALSFLLLTMVSATFAQLSMVKQEQLFATYNAYSPSVLNVSATVKRMWIGGWRTTQDVDDYLIAVGGGVNVTTIVGPDKIFYSTYNTSSNTWPTPQPIQWTAPGSPNLRGQDRLSYQ